MRNDWFFHLRAEPITSKVSYILLTQAAIRHTLCAALALYLYFAIPITGWTVFLAYLPFLLALTAPIFDEAEYGSPEISVVTFWILLISSIRLAFLIGDMPGSTGAVPTGDEDNTRLYFILSVGAGIFFLSPFLLRISQSLNLTQSVTYTQSYRVFLECPCSVRSRSVFQKSQIDLSSAPFF